MEEKEERRQRGIKEVEEERKMVRSTSQTNRWTPRKTNGQTDAHTHTHTEREERHLKIKNKIDCEWKNDEAGVIIDGQVRETLKDKKQDRL